MIYKNYQFYCNSLTECEKSKYCRKCSHANYSGKLEHNDKEVKFKFSPIFGFSFINKNGEISKRTPAENNPIWVKLHKWLEGIK